MRKIVELSENYCIFLIKEYYIKTSVLKYEKGR